MAKSNKDKEYHGGGYILVSDFLRDFSKNVKKINGVTIDLGFNNDLGGFVLILDGYIVNTNMKITEESLNTLKTDSEDEEDLFYLFVVKFTHELIEAVNKFKKTDLYLDTLNKKLYSEYNMNFYSQLKDKFKEYAEIGIY